MKLEERILIEIRLKEVKSISKISKEINKSKTTIFNEIKKCLNYTIEVMKKY